MSVRPLLVRSPRAAGLRAIVGEMNFGYPTYVTAALPDRAFVGLDTAERPPSIQLQEPALEVTPISTPLHHLVTEAGTERDSWPQESRRAVARLEALWLLLEDRHRLLDAELVEPLAHQASLVQHVLEQPSLRRVLIADEVGLGKTIEAGLLIKRLIEASPDRVLRVLYLSPARLVDNVVEEFLRMGLRPRRWTSEEQEARLLAGDSDPLVVASMHRAVYRNDEGVDHLGTVGHSGPWDVLIVDEAHHLTDYSPDASDPRLRMRLVKQLIKERLNPAARVVLMTGTPHQGHGDRFRNLLRLLDESGARTEGARGRIIYRTKDDIRDWDGQPLFPSRDVREPTVVRVGPRYSRWLRDIHTLLSRGIGSRMGLWRRAQALQWAASSPQAGLAYLVRMALRAGLTSRQLPSLRLALELLRPYRGGKAQETPEALERRLELLARSGDEGAEQFADQEGLASVIGMGAELVRDDVIAEKLAHVFGWLDDVPSEKFVVFAQPIETVYTLRSRIEQHLGPGTTALVVGDQDVSTRQEEIRRFRDDDRARVLVSSRAGGEGINLQVSRRLVHFDIPWNPMEMEQRVGRIHRFGSLKTIIVETLVLDGSRELRVLERCRARLGQIVRDLDPDRFSYLYGRTLSLVPMDDLALLMAGEDFGPLTAAEGDRIDNVITAGYDSWVEADREFRARSERIRSLERGVVREDDLEEFLTGSVGAVVDPGWRCRGFQSVAGRAEPEIAERPARVLRMPDNSVGFVGTSGGVGIVSDGSRTERPRRLGLNDAYVSAQVRLRLGEGPGGEPIRGGGLVLVSRPAWRSWIDAPGLENLVEGAILLGYVRRRIDLRASPFREIGSELALFVTSASGGTVTRISGEQSAEIIRLIRKPRPKRTRPTHFDGTVLLDLERRLASELAASAPGDPVIGVFPIVALWIEPTDD